MIHLCLPVADPGFLRGGGANPKGGGAPTYYLANFCRKLHENEEILDQRGGASLAPPLRSATAYSAITEPRDAYHRWYNVNVRGGGGRGCSKPTAPFTAMGIFSVLQE